MPLVSKAVKPTSRVVTPLGEILSSAASMAGLARSAVAGVRASIGASTVPAMSPPLAAATTPRLPMYAVGRSSAEL